MGSTDSRPDCHEKRRESGMDHVPSPALITPAHTHKHVRHIGTKVIAYNPRRRCGRRRVGVSNLVPVSSWGDEDTIEQGPGVRIVRGEDEEERP